MTSNLLVLKGLSKTGAKNLHGGRTYTFIKLCIHTLCKMKAVTSHGLHFGPDKSPLEIRGTGLPD